MAAVTSTIVAVGGLGLSAAQAVKANKDMKLAGKASEKASAELKGIKEQNAFKNVQVPTLGFELAQQAGAQRDAQALSAIQGAGAAGVIGGVGQLAQAGLQGDLVLAASAQDAQYNRDLQQANAGQGIEARRGEREFNIGMGAKQDAELQRAQAQARKTAAIEGMVKSAGSALTSASGLIDLYKTKKAGALDTGVLDTDGLGNPFKKAELGLDWRDPQNKGTNQIKPFTESYPYKFGNKINN